MFAENSDIGRAVKRKAKLDSINNLNFERNKKDKRTSIHSKYIPILSLFFVSFLHSEKYNSLNMQTASDVIWAYLSNIRAITA
jgi:hypothetical protein